MDIVNIFVPGIMEPVIQLSRLELAAKSRLFYDVFSSLSLCDGCGGQMAVIIPGEDRLTVEAVFSQAAHFNKKTSIFQDQAGYSALMRRLEFQGSFSPQQRVASPHHQAGVHQDETVEVEEVEEVTNKNVEEVSDKSVEAEREEEEETPSKDTQPDQRSIDPLILTEIHPVKNTPTDNYRSEKKEKPNYKEKENRNLKRSSLNRRIASVERSKLKRKCAPPREYREEDELHLQQTKKKPKVKVWRGRYERYTEFTNLPLCVSENIKDIPGMGKNKNEDKNICGICSEYDIDNEDVWWIECDQCSQWFHQNCVLLEDNVMEKFYCYSCSEDKEEESRVQNSEAEPESGLLTKASKVRNIRRKYKGEVLFPDPSISHLQCQLCTTRPVIFRTRSSLYSHYSLFHYRDRLMPFISIESSSCTICDKTLTPKNQHFLYHVGVAHGMIEDFMPTDHHIKKTFISRRRSHQQIGNLTDTENEDLLPQSSPPKIIDVQGAAIETTGRRSEEEHLTSTTDYLEEVRIDYRSLLDDSEDEVET